MIRTIPYPGQRRHKAVCEHCGDLPGHHSHRELAVEQHEAHMKARHGGRES